MSVSVTPVCVCENLSFILGQREPLFRGLISSLESHKEHTSPLSWILPLFNAFNICHLVVVRRDSVFMFSITTLVGTCWYKRGCQVTSYRNGKRLSGKMAYANMKTDKYNSELCANITLTTFCHNHFFSTNFYQAVIENLTQLQTFTYFLWESLVLTNSVVQSCVLSYPHCSAPNHVWQTTKKKAMLCCTYLLSEQSRENWYFKLKR